MQMVLYILVILLELICPEIALQDLKTGDTIIKYGVDIGKVVAPIKKGEHTHVQNVKTKRW